MKLSEREQRRLRKQYGPWAIVTGASSGIGRELAERLAESGLHLVLVARSRDVLDQLAGQLRKTFQIQTRVHPMDLSEATASSRLLSETADLDIGLLVAAAGYGTSGLFVQSDLVEARNMLQVNIGALLELTHHFSRRFKSRGRGGIILLSSMVAFQGVPYAAHYAATKAYVQSLGEALSLEMQSYGVDVLAAAPGPVASGFGERADMRMNMSMTPQDIGVPILKALGRRSTVLPGLLTKLLVGSLRTVPRWAKVRIMRLVMGGMTQHQRTVAG